MTDRQELERGLAELRKRKPRDWPLERTIRAALENLGNREVVMRALEALKKSPRARRAGTHMGDE